MLRKPGRIITFYSYKGGTGRTMALANVAWILASNGKRVLAVDWDLEAPGLHRYFRPFLLDKDLTSSPGIIDLVWDFAAATVAPIESTGEAEAGWHEDYADILRFAIALRWSFRPPGRLDFLPSGRQGPVYAPRVNSFNWQNFYDRLGGGAFLESVKDRMRQEYDYVLIDSRTGVSDTSGICTVQMPDDLVVCFTANHQSLEGAVAVASSVSKQWAEARARETAGRIFPVLMRAEAGEMSKLVLARQEARSRFSPFLDFLAAGARDEYWGAVETSYIPWYAFEEVLAPFVDEPKVINSLLGAAERLTQFLSDREVNRAIPHSREERAQVLNQCLRSNQAAFLAVPPDRPPLPSVSSVPERDAKEAEQEPLEALESSELGHRETQSNLPSPLKPNRFWNPGGWALPAMSLSLASAAMFTIVFAFLQYGTRMRSLFVLPLSLSLSLAAFSTGLAWFIVFRCRRRPGWLWPRIWALTLAVLTSATALLVVPWAKSSWSHALVVAGVAATLTLLPRLYKLPPDSGLVPHIALLAFLGVLVLSLFGGWVLGQWFTVHTFNP